MRTDKVTRGPHYDAGAPMVVLYLKFTKTSFDILFPAKGVVSYRQANHF